MVSHQQQVLLWYIGQTHTLTITGPAGLAIWGIDRRNFHRTPLTHSLGTKNIETTAEQHGTTQYTHHQARPNGCRSSSTTSRTSLASHHDATLQPHRWALPPGHSSTSGSNLRRPGQPSDLERLIHLESSSAVIYSQLSRKRQPEGIKMFVSTQW